MEQEGGRWVNVLFRIKNVMWFLIIGLMQHVALARLGGMIAIMYGRMLHANITGGLNVTKYTLTMNEEQAQVTIRALDLYIRLRIGQWRELTELCLPCEHGHIDEYCKRRDECDELLKEARRVVMPELTDGASYGVYKFEDTERAFNVLKAVRSACAWHRNPKGGITVDFDRPMAINVDEALPTCKVKEVHNNA